MPRMLLQRSQFELIVSESPQVGIVKGAEPVSTHAIARVTSYAKEFGSMSAEIAEKMVSPQKRFFTMDEVLARIRAVGISIDEETVEYHLYRTRKMPSPAKKVKRERYWTAEQIESFIAEL